MAAKSLTTEAIALTEKKMDMSLDDIIKMSKKNTSKGKCPSRLPIKSHGFQNGNASLRNPKIQRFMESRSTIRQGVLAQKRSNFNGNQFPGASQAAKRAAAMPTRNRAVRWNKQRAASKSGPGKAAAGGFDNGKDKATAMQRPQTMDTLFAHMKEERMRTVMSKQSNGGGNPRRTVQRRRPQHQRHRGFAGQGR